MSFVFVSHANDDKKKIRHIVDALIADGIAVWLDNPERMGFSADEVKRYFHRIRAGHPWEDEIEDALREAHVVLVCFSERFKDKKRDVLHKEAVVAQFTKKIICCHIDEVELATLPFGFAAEQIKDLRTDMPEPAAAAPILGAARRLPRSPDDLKNMLELFVHDIRQKMLAHRLTAAKSRGSRDAFTPYLINRKDQEDAVKEAVEEVKVKGGNRPFFISGPDNECVAHFLERLERHSVPGSLGGGRSWHQVIVDWKTMQPTDKFQGVYQRRLAEALELPVATGKREIGEHMKSLQRPVNVLSYLSPAGWRSTETQYMEAWLSFWRDLEAEVPGCAAIPMLCMIFNPAEPGWRDCPPGRADNAQFSNDAIWKLVQRLAGTGPKTGGFPFLGRRSTPAVLLAPPILHPVVADDAQTWIKSHFSDIMSVEHRKAAELTTSLFAKGRAVALSVFAERMAELFTTTQKARPTGAR